MPTNALITMILFSLIKPRTNAYTVIIIQIHDRERLHNFRSMSCNFLLLDEFVIDELSDTLVDSGIDCTLVVFPVTCVSINIMNVCL